MTVKSGFFSDGSSYNQADFNAFLLDSIGSGYVLGYENELRSQTIPLIWGCSSRLGGVTCKGITGWVTNEGFDRANATTNPRIR